MHRFHSFMPVDSPTLVASVRLPLMLYPLNAGKYPGAFARTSERSGTLLDFLEAVRLTHIIAMIRFPSDMVNIVMLKNPSR
jgi:hypothetical protein